MPAPRRHAWCDGTRGARRLHGQARQGQQCCRTRAAAVAPSAGTGHRGRRSCPTAGDSAQPHRDRLQPASARPHISPQHHPARPPVSAARLVGGWGRWTGGSAIRCAGASRGALRRERVCARLLHLRFCPVRISWLRAGGEACAGGRRASNQERRAVIEFPGRAALKCAQHCERCPGAHRPRARCIRGWSRRSLHPDRDSGSDAAAGSAGANSHRPCPFGGRPGLQLEQRRGLAPAAHTDLPLRPDRHG